MPKPRTSRGMLATEHRRFTHIVAEFWPEWMVVGRTSICARCGADLYWVSLRENTHQHLPLNPNGTAHDPQHASRQEETREAD